MNYGKNFHDTISDAAESIVDTLGFDAVFHPSVGDNENFKVNLVSEPQFAPGTFEAQTWGNKITLEYKRGDLSREPNKGETITITDFSRTFTVDSMDDPDNDAFFARVIVY